MDNQAAYYNSAGLLLAIYQRMLTGQGTEVDVSAVEAGIGLLGSDLLDTVVNDRPGRRADYPRGDRLEHPAAAPHCVHPAAGDDLGIAIAAFRDPECKSLRTATGEDRKSTRLISTHQCASCMPSSAWKQQHLHS